MHASSGGGAAGNAGSAVEILLIEDSLDQATLMSRWLEAGGPYRVTTAQDGLRGAELAAERRWGCVVTDLNLPGSDGVEVVRASKSAHPDTPVIAITAYRDQSYGARALREGADGFLPKPLTMRVLVDKVTELIRSGVSARAAGPTVLAVGAHVDDVENGCGGALLRHLDLGHRVVVLVLSQDERDGSPPRIGEAELAARLMGTDVVLGDLPAGEIEDDEEAVSVIQRVADAFEPEIVYTHTEHDDDPDHRNTYRAVVMAVPSAPTVFCFESTAATVEFRPDRFVDITEYLERKKEIVSLFQTHDANRPYLKPGFVEASAIYWGRFVDYGRAEPLELVRGEGDEGSPGRASSPA